jgi:hypothetical protein
MKYFAKIVGIFIGLTILLILAGEFLLNLSLPFSGIFLYSAFTGILLTILYGWIDVVYIKRIHP